MIDTADDIDLTSGIQDAIWDLTRRRMSYASSLEAPLIPRLMLGDARRKHHRLEFHPLLRSHETHLMLFGMVLLELLWKSPLRTRAFFRCRHLPEEIREYILDEYPEASEEKRHDLEVMTGRNIVHLVVTLPLALEVERQIYARYPQHRPQQRAYLLDVARAIDILPFPGNASGPIAAGVRALEHAYLAEYSRIISIGDDESSPSIRIPPPRSAGIEERLVQRLRAILNVKGMLGASQRTIGDECATALGIRDWYLWAPSTAQWHKPHRSSRNDSP